MKFPLALRDHLRAVHPEEFKRRNNLEVIFWLEAIQLDEVV